jgi:hypothetical protein
MRCLLACVFSPHVCVHIPCTLRCVQSIEYAARNEQDNRDLLQAAVEEQRRVRRQKSQLRRRGSLEVRSSAAARRLFEFVILAKRLCHSRVVDLEHAGGALTC